MTTGSFASGAAGGLLGSAIMRLATDSTQFDRGLSKSKRNALATAKQITKALSLIGAVGIAASAKAAIDWESAFIGVTKTVEATEKQFNKLEGQLRRLALTKLPFKATEIARVAEIGGQMGIAVDQLEKFAETILNLTATTNLSMESAALELAKFTKIMGTADGDFERLGSTIVHLGNNFATTESQIVSMTMRMAGAGKAAGFLEADLLGIATAMSSLGLRQEMGGTAIDRIILEMYDAVVSGSKKLELFADVANMTGEAFTKAFAVEPVEAFTQFFEGLGEKLDVAKIIGKPQKEIKRIMEEGTEAEKDELNRLLDIGLRTEAPDVFQTIRDLNLNEIRVRQVLLRTAASGGHLRDAIAIANDEWERNLALQIEAEKRYASMASSIQFFKNKITDLMITMGNFTMPPIIAFIEKELEPAIAKFGQEAVGVDNILRKTFDPESGYAINEVAGRSNKAYSALAETLKAIDAPLTMFWGYFKNGLHQYVAPFVKFIITSKPILIAAFAAIGAAIILTFGPLVTIPLLIFGVVAALGALNHHWKDMGIIARTLVVVALTLVGTTLLWLGGVALVGAIVSLKKFTIATIVARVALVKFHLTLMTHVIASIVLFTRSIILGIVPALYSFGTAIIIASVKVRVFGANMRLAGLAVRGVTTRFVLLNKVLDIFGRVLIRAGWIVSGFSLKLLLAGYHVRMFGVSIAAATVRLRIFAASTLKAVIPALRALGVAVVVATAKLIAMGVSWAIAFWPVTLIVAAIGVLVGSIIWMRLNMEKTVKFFESGMGKIVRALFPAVGLAYIIARHWGQITDVVSRIWNDITYIITGETDKEKGILAKQFDWLKENWKATLVQIALVPFTGMWGLFFGPVGGSPFMEAFKTKLGEVGAAIKTFVTETVPQVLIDSAFGIGEWIGEAIPNALTKLGELRGKFITWLTETVPQFLRDNAFKIGEWLGNALPVVVEKLGELAGKFITWLTVDVPTFLTDNALKVGEWISETLPVVAEKLGELAGKFVAWLTVDVPAFLADAPFKIGAWVSESLPTFLEKLGEIGSNIWTFLTVDMPNFFTRAIPSVIDAVANFWDAIWSGTFDMAKLLVFGAPKLVLGAGKVGLSVADSFARGFNQGIGDSQFNHSGGAASHFPEAEYMATGGIVTRPTLAMIGEGGAQEAVIPLDRMGEFAGSAAKIENHYHIDNLYGYDDFGAAVDEVRLRSTRRGRQDVR